MTKETNLGNSRSLPTPFILFCILTPLLVFGLAWMGYQSEQAYLESLSVEERQLMEEEALAEQERQAKAQQEIREKDSQFENEMKAYETSGIRYKQGVRGQYGGFVITDIEKRSTFTFGENLPSGSRASFQMSGRGEVGLGHAGRNTSRWQRAGQHGIYNFTSLSTQNVNDGDFVKFKHLEQVEIWIWF